MSGNDELEEELSVTCVCGHIQKVPVSKAESRVKCEACGSRVKVSRIATISSGSRKSILSELGIEGPEEGDSSDGEIAPRTYVCTRCKTRVPSDELNSAYVASELLCSSCRAAVNIRGGRVVPNRPEPKRGERLSDSANKKAKPANQPLKSEVTYVLPPGLKEALTYGLLFFIGIGGPIYFVFGVRPGIAVAIALPFALIGTFVVHQRS